MQKTVKKPVSRVRAAACALLFLAALADTSQVLAAETPHDYTFNVSAGGLKFSGQDDLSHSLVYDIRFGYDIVGTSIVDSLGIEGGLSYASATSSKDNTKARAYLMRIDAIYPFLPRKRLVPFLAVGAGGMVIERPTTTEGSPLLAWGGGMKYFLTEYLALRMDVRQNILFNVGSRNDFQYMLGLSFLMDRDTKIRRLPLPPPPPADRKGTAAPAVPIIDFDKPQEPGKKAPEKPAEPETPAQVPLPAAVIAAPIAAVTGLLNQPEQAKAEAPQETVAAAAKPVEAPPQPEPAPQTRVPVKVELAEPFAAPLPDASSQEMIESILCPVDPPATQKQRVLKKPSATIFFDNGSAVIKPQFMTEINRIVAYVKKHPGSEVHIEGHTDRNGTSDRNVDLSRARMISVKQALVKKIGRVKVKLTEQAFGCRLPVESNREEKGRSKNRRATIEVTPP
ncbi:OmpA family protein [Geomonas terrae]|uniref:OmpA family protein n=1 Tax=Geomonas terrae TaxID=2562681 RepID=A0A4S1CAA7_9BACT|nr:OmpA family protein [Geomonas terrae]TGU70234.1 OmpA family protein [Geomonas terrae]